VVTLSRLKRKKFIKTTTSIINERISASELRVVDGGENLGIISKEQALKIAREKDMDLVLIAPKANPPVAKILDHKKFLYEERKKRSAAKAKSKKSLLKELKIRPTTGEGDFNLRIEKAKNFVNSGNRVKMTVVLRGRENTRPELATDRLARVTKELEDIAKPENEPKRLGRGISVVYVKK